MDTSKSGLELIKHFEGLRLKAYKCPAGVWTIGYGHTRTVDANQVITEEQAEALLVNDVEPTEDKIESYVKVEINQGQFDALVSFAFNVGTGALKRSTLLRVLNKGDYEEAANQFGRWVKAGGRTLKGLVKRRQTEALLFKTGNLVTPRGIEDEIDEMSGVIVDMVD